MVEGASRGIGFAVARILAAEGAHLSILSRDGTAVEAAAATLWAETGGRVLATAADFRDPSTAEAWCARTVERFGGVDLLFANSGGPRPGGFDSVDAAAWRDAFDLLLLGTVRVVRAVTPAMRAGGGGAILVSTSSSVKEPLAQLVLSNVMRPAVAALAKMLALELADSGIRVNYIVPGRIETDRLTELDAFAADRSGESPTDLRESMQRDIPLQRYGAPEEFGRAAAFLLSDTASYVTGATLQVDGGRIRSVL